MTWLVFRYHTLKIMFEAVVFHSVGPSKSPNFMIFKRFQIKCGIIDKASHQATVSDYVTHNCVPDIAKAMIAFAKNQLREFQ